MRNLKIILFLLISGLLSACGRYGSTIAPEALAPRAVQQLEVMPDISGVKLSWESPELDQRGRELRMLDSYRVYRAVLADSAQVINDRSLAYELLTVVEDRHLAELESLRNEAEAQGRSARKIQSSKAARQFSYLDSNVTNEVVYVYKIVPVNQGDVYGAVNQLMRVRFRAADSEIRRLNNESASAAPPDDSEE